jgi:hypothetical protein
MQLTPTFRGFDDGNVRASCERAAVTGSNATRERECAARRPIVAQRPVHYCLAARRAAACIDAIPVGAGQIGVLPFALAPIGDCKLCLVGRHDTRAAVTTADVADHAIGRLRRELGNVRANCEWGAMLSDSQRNAAREREDAVVSRSLIIHCQAARRVAACVEAISVRLDEIWVLLLALGVPRPHPRQLCLVGRHDARVVRWVPAGWCRSSGWCIGRVRGRERGRVRCRECCRGWCGVPGEGAEGCGVRCCKGVGLGVSALTVSGMA